MKTVGELKNFIKDLPDDMLLISRSNNFVLENSLVEGIDISVESFNIEKKQFIDGFDYTIFYKDVYVRNKNGNMCLKFG
jgi:hypothetical protein